MKRLMLLITAVAALALIALPGAALAKSRDRNHDRIPDKWERHFHLSLSRNQAKLDQDHDGLKNRQEFKNHTNPRDADTDNDGLEDGQEVETVNNPRDADTDDNGVEDENENSGTITSFDAGTGTLVIDVGNGRSVTGHVASGVTRIECRTREEQENENENEVRSADDGSGDNSGPGSGDSSGSDNSGPGSTSSGPGDGAQQNEGTTCGTSDLTTGTVVHEAELEGQTFEKVELIK